MFVAKIILLLKEQGKGNRFIYFLICRNLFRTAIVIINNFSGLTARRNKQTEKQGHCIRQQSFLVSYVVSLYSVSDLISATFLFSMAGFSMVLIRFFESSSCFFWQDKMDILKAKTLLKAIYFMITNYPKMILTISHKAIVNTSKIVMYHYIYSNPILFVAKTSLLFRQQARGNSQQVRVSTFLSTF